MLPSYSDYASYWQHDKDIVFLNHGSFGSCPVPILDKQTALRNQMESEPVRFVIDEFEPLYEENKIALAEFVKCNPNDLVFVRNATMGVNTILHSLKFNEGDEILIHNHGYGACLNAVHYYAELQHCKVITAEIPFPIENEDQVVEAFLKALTPRTKFALVDHITSATGLVFPIEKITKELESRGIEVLIDGAHAPGMVDLNIDALGASYYTGNCHKWLCTPKGAALLHVRKDKQAKIIPLQISHFNDLYTGTEKHWSAQFMWPGTEDFTAYFCVKDSIHFMGNLMGSWEKLRNRNREICLNARKHIAEKTGTALPAPDTMISHLANILVDNQAILPEKFFNMTPPLKKILMEEYKIEVPVFLFNKSQPRFWVRIAVEAYNSIEQYEYLGNCLEEILKGNASGKKRN